jgi:hypothetical protein
LGGDAGVGGQPAGAGGVGGTAVGGASGMSGSAGWGGGSPTNCLNCVTMACDTAQECFENPACVEGLICGAGACGGLEGTPAFECWFECFGGDVELALLALDGALCLAQNCTVACQF